MGGGNDDDDGGGGGGSGGGVAAGKQSDGGRWRIYIDSSDEHGARCNSADCDISSRVWKNGDVGADFRVQNIKRQTPPTVNKCANATHCRPIMRPGCVSPACTRRLPAMVLDDEFACNLSSHSHPSNLQSAIWSFGVHVQQQNYSFASQRFGYFRYNASTGKPLHPSGSCPPQSALYHPPNGFSAHPVAPHLAVVCCAACIR